jgi:hypothetical protein
MEKAEENYSETVTAQPFLRNAFYVTLGDRMAVFEFACPRF